MGPEVCAWADFPIIVGTPWPFTENRLKKRDHREIKGTIWKTGLGCIVSFRLLTLSCCLSWHS